MSCECQCSYCVSCNSTPKTKLTKELEKMQFYPKEKRLYTKKQAD